MKEKYALSPAINLTGQEDSVKLSIIMDKRRVDYIRSEDLRIGIEYFSFREAERMLMAQRLEKKGKIEEISYEDFECVKELGMTALVVLRERFDNGETGLGWRIKYAEENLEFIRNDIRAKHIYDKPIKW